MLMTEVLYRVCESLPPNDGREMTIGLAVATAVSDKEPELSGEYYSHCSYDLRAVSNNQLFQSLGEKTYPPLEVSSPAFIQPEMLPRSIRDKVTAPAMR